MLDDSAAEALLLGLVKETGGPVVIDVPETAVHATAEPLVRRHGMSEVFRCARMYTGGRPALAQEKVFGITSLEQG